LVTLNIDHSEHRGHDNAPSEPRLPGRGNGAGRPAIPTITVDGVVIDAKAVAAEMQNHGGDSAEVAMRRAATALIVRQLLLAEAARLGITGQPEASADGRRETDEDATIRALIEAEVAVPDADEASLRRYYDNNRRRFVTAPLWEVDHILFAARRDDPAAFAAAREKAASLLGQLVAEPHRFAEFARDISDCPSADVGGSLGQIGEGETTSAFEAALDRLLPGEISEPVETPYGVHIIRLVRRIEGVELPFEAVRDRIAGYLADSVDRRAGAEYVGLLAGRAEITGFDIAGAASPLLQ
jgi:peptidyl-prolyl cis-trans isomerase C